MLQFVWASELKHISLDELFSEDTELHVTQIIPRRLVLTSSQLFFGSLFRFFVEIKCHIYIYSRPFSASLFKEKLLKKKNTEVYLCSSIWIIFSSSFCSCFMTGITEITRVWRRKTWNYSVLLMLEKTDACWEVEEILSCSLMMDFCRTCGMITEEKEKVVEAEGELWIFLMSVVVLTSSWRCSLFSRTVCMS